MAERTDKKQALPWRFRDRNETIQVDAVANDLRISAPEELCIFRRHRDNPAETADGAPLESSPPPQVPPGGDRRLPLVDLPEQIECDIMLHEHVSAVTCELCVLSLKKRN